MWDWLGSIFSNGSNLQGVGSIIGGLGQGYGAIEQAKQAKAMLNLQKESYYDEKKRRKDTQLALDSSFKNLNASDALQPKLNLGV